MPPLPLEILERIMNFIPDFKTLLNSALVILHNRPRANPRHLRLAETQGVLPHLRRLKLYAQGRSGERCFPALFSSSRRHAPLTYLDTRLPIAGGGLCGDWCKFVSNFSPTLRALRIHPGYKNFAAKDYASLDLALFSSLSSITVEPVLLYDLRTGDIGGNLLDLLLLLLTAPFLRKLTLVLVIDHERSVDALGQSMSWATLDRRVECLRYLEEMKIVLTGCTAMMQMQGVHRKAEKSIRELLPEVNRTGRLILKVASMEKVSLDVNSIKRQCSPKHEPA
ncbi:hypothetical protein HDZ31DRAFT_77429, partial [Schizophyllum fasciatum]